MPVATHHNAQFEVLQLEYDINYARIEQGTIISTMTTCEKCNFKIGSLVYTVLISIPNVKSSNHCIPKDDHSSITLESKEILSMIPDDEKSISLHIKTCKTP